MPVRFKQFLFSAWVLPALCLAGGFMHAGEADKTSLDYAKHGVTYLERHCVECHGVKSKKSGLDLRPYKDEALVLKDRAMFKTALTMIQAHEMPPEDKPRPKLEETEAFIRAVAGIYEKADRNAKPNAGFVAMRRFNRVEYNNTVRDLMGIDFNAAEDFPNDEVGHGFDNISDVQWISAVHMERYLAAAEMIAQRAVASEPGNPPKRYQAGKFCEPASQDVPKGKFRPINGDKPNSAVLTGPLNTPYKVAPDGEYIFRVRLYAAPKDGKPVKIAILLNGSGVDKPAPDNESAKLYGAALGQMKPFKIMKIAEVKALSENKAETIEVKIPSGMGIKRMAVALVKPDDGSPVGGIFVEHLALEGPMDTRPAFQRAMMTFPEGSPQDKNTRIFMRKFAMKAYRRAPTDAEVERLSKIVDAAVARKESWESGVQFALQVILSSPKFLFRPEMDSRVGEPGLRPLNEFELASRLSYFLWSSMPDDELFALAEKNQLGAQLDAQVRRMLKDPRARALTDNFAMQWLQLRRLDAFTPDTKIFTNFTPRLKSAMKEEVTLFIDAIFREDRSILDLIDAKFTFLNEPLARHYGITDTNGNRSGQKKPGKPGGKAFVRGENQFMRVELSDDERSGLLTKAGILAVTSNPTRTSPVKRGKWVLDQLLGTPPPPPPPDVPDLDNNKVLTGTLRQRLEQHRANPNCASCHARMDPIGFAFENYDAVGAFRTQDEGKPIDTAGTLPGGQKIAGATGLKEVLKSKKELFSRCLIQKLMTYALGRGIEVYDTRSVDKIMDALAKDNYKFSTMVVEIAKSAPFRNRGEEEEVHPSPKKVE